MSETRLSKSIQSALEAVGVWVIRINSGTVPVHGRYVHLAEPGTPDLCLPALGAWLEVKVSGGKLSAAQIAWHSRAAQCGVRVAVVRSVNEAMKVVSAWRADMRGRMAG